MAFAFDETSLVFALLQMLRVKFTYLGLLGALSICFCLALSSFPLRLPSLLIHSCSQVCFSLAFLLRGVLVQLGVFSFLFYFINLSTLKACDALAETTRKCIKESQLSTFRKSSFQSTRRPPVPLNVRFAWYKGFSWKNEETREV